MGSVAKFQTGNLKMISTQYSVSVEENAFLSSVDGGLVAPMKVSVKLL